MCSLNPFLQYQAKWVPATHGAVAVQPCKTRAASHVTATSPFWNADTGMQWLSSAPFANSRDKENDDMVEAALVTVHMLLICTTLQVTVIPHMI